MTALALEEPSDLGFIGGQILAHRAVKLLHVERPAGNRHAVLLCKREVVVGEIVNVALGITGQLPGQRCPAFFREVLNGLFDAIHLPAERCRLSRILETRQQLCNVDVGTNGEPWPLSWVQFRPWWQHQIAGMKCAEVPAVRIGEMEDA